MSSNHHQPNASNASSNYNGALGGGDPNDYQDWANGEFNLLEFIGEEENNSPTNPDLVDHFDAADRGEEESMDKKDMIYQNLQYTALMCEPSMGESQLMLKELFRSFEPSPPSPNLRMVVSDGYMDAPQGYHDPHQLATPPTFMVNGNDHALYGSGGGGGGGSGGGSGRMDGSQMPSTSRAPNTGGGVAVKVEPPSMGVDYYESESDRRSSADRRSMDTESQVGGPMRTPYQPRKYHIKSEVEKKNPVYKVKRERNNDAVRRSRDKAKREQEQKDERLFYLEQERPKSEMAIKRLQERNALLEKALMQAKQQCRCGARRILP